MQFSVMQFSSVVVDSLFSILLLVLLVVVYAAYNLLVAPHFSPLHDLPGPPISGLLGTHLDLLLDAGISAKETEKMVNKYGRTFRILGMGVVRLSQSQIHLRV